MNISHPKNQTAEVLYFLLKNEKIDYKLIYVPTGILNLSARISDLRLDYGLDIPCKEVETKNKFGRKISYGTWSLTDKESGRIIYSKINK